MLTITVGNSYSKISGLTSKEERELRDALSYTVGGSGAYFSKFKPRKASLLDKRCEFPSGLLRKVCQLTPPGALCDVQDTRVPPKTLDFPSLKEVTPYKWQVQAQVVAEAKERGVIRACTGSGKSLYIALLAARLSVKTLVVVPTVELRKQLTESLLNVFNGIPPITIKNIDDPSLKKDTDYGLLIIDEAHRSAASTYRKLNKTAWTGIYYRINTTATDFRTDPEEQLLYEGIAGPTIFNYSYREAVRDGVVVPIEGYYIQIPKTPNDFYTWQEVYKKLVVDNEMRNELIALTLLRLNASQSSTLCLVKEVKHGKAIADMTQLPFVYGGDDDSRAYIQQFKDSNIKALIGTYGVTSEGVDTKPCEYVILCGLGTSKSALMQAFGRGIRKYPGKDSCKIILIKDDSHKFTKKHFNVQKKVLLEEYGVKVMKLEV
jgi:superfamily II DNA or RNA helicase